MTSDHRRLEFEKKKIYFENHLQGVEREVWSMEKLRRFIE